MSNPLCSFCDKPVDKVKKLIQHKNAFICNECICLCVQILFEEFELCTPERRKEPLRR